VRERDERRGGRRRSRRPSVRLQAAPEAAVSADVRRGYIKWFNRGRSYGFIQTEDGTQVFFHESAVVLGASEGSLVKGQVVEFELRDTPKGQQAVNVVLSGEAAPTPPRPAPRAATQAAPDHEKQEPVETTLDFSKRLPNSWKHRTATLVYSYTLISSRR